MLELSHVSAGYGSFDVLHDVSFAVSPGERLAVIGANGCGKTTLLRAISGVLPYRGEITVRGRAVRQMKRREIAREVGVLAQMGDAYFSYTVYDTVMMGRYLQIADRRFGNPSEEDHARVRDCLETVDMLDLADREITRLSGGQLQRVFLARTFAQEPSIILLDEPTNHLDLRYQIELTDYLQAWTSEGERAVVAVLHDVNLALHFCDTALLLKDGVTVGYGKAKDTVSRGRLQEVYQVDVVDYMHKSLRLWHPL